MRVGGTASQTVKCGGPRPRSVTPPLLARSRTPSMTPPLQHRIASLTPSLTPPLRRDDRHFDKRLCQRPPFRCRAGPAAHADRVRRYGRERAHSRRDGAAFFRRCPLDGREALAAGGGSRPGELLVVRQQGSEFLQQHHPAASSSSITQQHHPAAQPSSTTQRSWGRDAAAHMRCCGESWAWARSASWRRRSCAALLPSCEVAEGKIR